MSNRQLCDAAKSGDVAEIERQIAAGADPNALVNDYSPLQRAAENGHLAAIAALLKAGARVDGVDSDGYTPLMCAAWHGHKAVFDALVAAGADVQCANNRGLTALHYASMYGRPDAARVLLAAGARTDVRNKAGERPIDVVRCAAPSPVAAVRLLHAAASPRCHAQVCNRITDKTDESALRSLIAAAAPWSRRRPVAIACHADVWEWEVEA
jgi:ankyrin repeat protein